MQPGVRARDGLSDRLLLDALAAELAAMSAEGQPLLIMPPALLIGLQACAAVSEANALAGVDRVRLLHLDGAAAALGCGFGNQESLYDADADTALPVQTFRVVCLNVEAARSYRVLRELAVWAAARVAPGGCLLLAGPRKGGAEVAADAVRPLVAQLHLLTYRKGHRVYRARGAATTLGAPEGEGRAELDPWQAGDAQEGGVRRADQAPPLHHTTDVEATETSASKCRGGACSARSASVLRAARATGDSASTITLHLRGQTLQLVQDNRIFARGQVDPATRLLAETFTAPPGADLLDLGCGSGALGILAALLDPTSHCTLVDADPLAVAVARQSAALSGAANVTVVLSNILAALPGQTFDVVVMNPPFHRGRREDRALGERFVKEAAAALRPGGRLWVVCNRFLPYERTLQPVLRDVREAAGDRSYKVLTGRQ